MPTVSLAPTFGVGYQAFTNGGKPLTDGLLYTYIAGGTTPQATYTSTAGSVQNANPIELDASGRPPSEIWLLVSASYRFDLKDADGNLIKTFDNIGGIASSADLANTSTATLGDALVGFKQSNASGALSGAVASTVHNKLQEIISVKDFGAVGDGSTDDTAAFQAAISALPAGSSLLVPYGGYKITSTLVLSNAIKIVGSGRQNLTLSRLLKGSSMTSALIRITGVDVTLQDICCAGQAGNTGDGISIEAQRCVLRNVTVEEMGRDGIRVGTDAGTNANLWTFDSVFTYSNVRYGLYLHDGTTNANAGLAARCFFWSNGDDGVRIGSACLNTFSGCTSETNTGYGINFNSASTHDNWWFAGDIEANTAGNVNRVAGATRNNVVGSVASYTLGAAAYNDANISVNDSTDTILTLNSERFDTDDCHSTSVNTSRLTCNTAGKYLINAKAGFASNATGRRAIRIKKNGATYLALDSRPAVNGDTTWMEVSTFADLAANDYVEMEVYQTSGGALNILTFASASPELAMIRQN